MKASILIAAGDGVGETMRCLQSVADTVEPSTSFEVVLVDDATTDGTAAALRGVGGDFRVLRNERRRGMEASWARAASVARGEHLVMLRHDAIAKPGWLEALIAALEGDPGIAAARARRPPGTGGEPPSTCVAVRSEGLAAAGGDGVAGALRNAAARAIEIPEAAVELARPLAPRRDRRVPRVGEIREFGSFLATRLAGQAGEVVFCPSVSHAISDLSGSVAVGLVPGEASTDARELIAARSGLRAGLEGVVASEEGSKTAPLTVFDRWSPAALPTAPASFRVLAVVTAYNESDVIVQTVGALLADGIDVHLLDNWSTDGTFELVGAAFGERVTRERFPAEGPSPTYDWVSILDRVEEITRERPSDWAIHQDADEVRESPWPGVGLRDGLHLVGLAGFNCIDHTVLNFRPVDDSFVEGADLDASFPWCEFAAHQSDFMQLKAWAAPGAAVGLSIDGGHQVRFPGRRIFPYKFLLRHYPIRSQRHGERKVLHERRGRWNPDERARGWHVHYDAYHEASSFVWDRDGLLRFDDERFRPEHLLERISGVGLAGMQAAAHAQIQAGNLVARHPA